jgi:transcription elongation factor SPT6
MVFVLFAKLIIAAKQMFSEELFHDPNLRRYYRELLLGSKSQSSIAYYSVRPTERGIKKIDDSHPYYRFKYLTNQRVGAVSLNPDRFLQIMAAESEGLVTVELTIPGLEDRNKEVVSFINTDNQSELAMAWNKLREDVLNNTLARLIPHVMNLAKESLRVECEDILATICRQQFLQRLDQAPFQAEELDKGQTPSVLAISCGSGDFSRDAVICAFVDDSGRLLEQMKLSDVRELENKTALAEFIDKRNPDVVGIAGFSAQTVRLHDDIVKMMKDRSDISRQVVYVNDEVARLYQNSKRGLEEFPDVGALTRYCIALARYLQNPLMEYLALGRDVISIPVHKQQSLIGEEKLYRAFETAMVDIVNLCGVDINEAVRDSYKALALPFVAGLGPRKAQSVIKKITHAGGYLENRSELITKQVVSRNIFMNCASFLRIQGSGKDADPLDATRIHPEDYDLAKKMAGDALELDEEDVVAAESEGGVVKLLMDDDPEKLNDLILEEYADQLVKAFNQLKRNTLEQIKDELQGPYEELRRDFKLLSVEEIFTMLTGESEDSLREGIVVPVSICRVRDRFASALLDCGVEGNIAQNEMSDDPMAVGSQLFQPNQTVNAVILSLDRSSFAAELSTRESRINDARRLARMHPEINPNEWDDYAEERDSNKVAAKREAEAKTTRMIKHPLFRSFNSRQAEDYLSGMQRGDAVIRPSSLGPDHIAITWKVAEGVYQHVGTSCIFAL